jgi:hypothetical protein
MGDKMVVIREHGPSFKRSTKIARHAKKSTLQNIETLRRAKLMCFKISARSDEVRAEL